MPKVNIDALITREDFEVNEENNLSFSNQSIQIRDLEGNSFFYPVLRKPDFQRETSDWTENKIMEFIKSFLEGDLIPAIILWNSGSNIFVIDGAHRLSALIAWVNDDYGDGQVSRSFFENILPSDQIKASDKTRRLIRKELGSYEDHKFAISNPQKADPQILDRAKRLASVALQLQWVKGNAQKAEDSFFKINQQATPIDKTELRILKSRKKPNALAARAIIRSGTGHKYWSSFDIEVQQQIEHISKEINSILFTPPLNTPIKTLDLPLAGRGYSSRTLQLVLELVNLTNNLSIDSEIDPDDTGEETIRYLKQVRKYIYRLSGTHASSLGLHPAVYFYSDSGRYQQTSFFAMLSLIIEFEKKKYFDTFTKHRKKYENFLIKFKTLSNQVTLKQGSGLKGFRQLKDLHMKILESFDKGNNEKQTIDAIKSDENFKYLTFGNPANDDPVRKNFSSDVKSATFLKEALKNPIRCSICGGLMHRNSITMDHIVRKQDGGMGVPDNAQMAHPYCNTTYKN